jgi:SAM-dependent methyltransferase
MQLYEELAELWPLVSPPADYEEEAREYLDLLREAASAPIRDLLELGSGGGNNASHLKAHLSLTLVEPSEPMRRVSERLNPECTHLPGDMRTVRLGRTFDAVLIHDAIVYMATEDDLTAALRTAAEHLRPGGVALFAPDATRETFRPGAGVGGGDDPASGRGLRWLEWVLPPAEGATSHEVHYAILVREADGRVRPFHDVHHHGLFPRATWLRLLDGAGLRGRVRSRTEAGAQYDLLVAVRR